jgi:hypothetical protein
MPGMMKKPAMKKPTMKTAAKPMGYKNGGMTKKPMGYKNGGMVQNMMPPKSKNGKS